MAAPSADPSRREPLAIIAGNNRYPFLLAEAARKEGVSSIRVIAFENETDPALAKLVDEMVWLRVGQLGKMLKQLTAWRVQRAIMAGQIAPKNLFDLRPDFRALFILAKLKERNAETLFGAIGDEMAGVGVTLLPATTYLEHLLAPAGHIAGPKPGRSASADAEFGLRIAKESSRLDIGQSVVVKKGTVLAVEAFEGTDDCIRRGGSLGRGGATLCKVSKPRQDLRFDVPVIGTRTLETCAEAGVSTIVVEAGKTLLLDRDAVLALAAAKKITLLGA